jgi:hypothetical protein
MSRYTVTWLREVEGDLARIWIRSADRHSVAVAANTIDSGLGHDAQRKGTAVAEGLRSVHVPPLYALMIVREADRLVEIVSIRSDGVLPTLADSNGSDSVSV